MDDREIPAEAERLAHDAVTTALGYAASHGADAAEAGASFETGLSVTARQRDIESLEFQNDRGFSVTVYRDQRKGSASTSDLSREAIETTVAKALYIADQTEKDTYSGLAEAARMAKACADLDLDHSWALDAEAAGDLALETEAAALAHDARISNSEGASVATQRGLSVYGNSHGFVGTQRRSLHTVSCAVLAENAEGMERDYYYDSARNPARLLDGVAVGQRAAQRVVSRLSPTKLDTCDAPVLFLADLAGGLIGHLLGAVAGGAQYRKATYLLDALGETVMNPAVSIFERPHLAEGIGSKMFDAEGVATEPGHIVRDGVLERYILSSYSARRLGRETTGNAGGVHNATISGGGGSLDDMLKTLDRGFLVTEMMGQGVNLVTGDYSRGAAGFWVENGEIQYPISEVTVAGNLDEMFKHIVAIGDDRDERRSVHCGSVLIESMKIAGN
ncbi:MAG: metalloprotease PmbA [Pseudomonadota bacterium]